MVELRAVSAYGVARAPEPALVICAGQTSDDPGLKRPSRRGRDLRRGSAPPRLQRTAAIAARAAAREASTSAAAHAALAASAASAAAHPSAGEGDRSPTFFGAAAHLGGGTGARGRSPLSPNTCSRPRRGAPPRQCSMFSTHLRAPHGRTFRVAALTTRLDSCCSDPPSVPRVVGMTWAFFHGTRADVRPGDLLPTRLAGSGTTGSGPNGQAHLLFTASSAGAPLLPNCPRRGPPCLIYIEPFRADRGRPECHRQALPRQPHPVLSHH